MIRLPKCITIANHRRKLSPASTLANEDGSVIIVALVVLMLLTMIGTSATNTSTLEIQVAGNERNYKRNFFKTEAAAMYSAQRIENSGAYDDAFIQPSGFQYDEDAFKVDQDPTNGATVDPPGRDNPTTSPDNFSNIGSWKDLEDEEGSAYADSFYMAVHIGVAAGASLDMTATSQLHAFSVYGQLYDNNKRERMIIETGYGKRY